MGTSYLFYDRLCVTNCQKMQFASCLLYVDTTMAHPLCQVFHIFIGKGQVRGLEWKWVKKAVEVQRKMFKELEKHENYHKK